MVLIIRMTEALLTIKNKSLYENFGRC